MLTPWYDKAKAELGQHEIAGPAANQRIVEYHSATSLHATSDEVPWCSSFVNWCMKQVGLHPTGSAAANSWLTWGVPCEPIEGCVVVIRQRSVGHDAATGSASGFHVGFLAGTDLNVVRILGGNQADSVKYSNFPLSGYEVKGYRLPAQNS